MLMHLWLSGGNDVTFLYDKRNAIMQSLMGSCVTLLTEWQTDRMTDKPQ